MKRLIEFPLKDGGSILVEVDDIGGPGPGGVTRSIRPNQVLEKAQVTFEEALNNIRPAAESIITRLRGLSDPPTEIQVKFGLKLSAEAGAFIASVGADVNYEVTLTWQRKEQKEG